MAAEIAMTGGGTVDEISAYLQSAIESSGMSCEQVGGIHHGTGTAEMCVMVFEKYFWRNGNYASLTVSIFGHNKKIIVDAVASGAGGGLLNLSRAADEEFVEAVEAALKSRGFEEYERESWKDSNCRSGPEAYEEYEYVSPYELMKQAKTRESGEKAENTMELPKAEKPRRGLRKKKRDYDPEL